jgi:large subunit ribosomal protein L22
MEIQASYRFAPISAQKVRLVVNQVRGMPVDEALNLLFHMPQKGAPIVSKVITSAVANATQNFGLEPETLFIEKIYADEGPTRKWRKFGARGRFKPWLRRSSHVTVILNEVDTVSEEEVDDDAGESEES